MDERTTIDRLIAVIESEQDAHPDQVGSALMQALSVRDVAVQRVALGSLPRGAANNPRWRAYVQDAMASEDSLVRCEAAEAAGRLQLSEAVPALMRLLRDPRSLVRVCAVMPLGSGCSRGCPDNHGDAGGRSELDRARLCGRCSRRPQRSSSASRLAGSFIGRA